MKPFIIIIITELMKEECSWCKLFPLFQEKRYETEASRENGKEALLLFRITSASSRIKGSFSYVCM